MVRQMLPEVTVPDFPARPEELAPCMAKIYEEYFARAVITKEDREKTAQYRANAGRNAMAEQAVSFEDYVKKLEICLIPVDPKEHLDRLTQLLNKTNQFNLTTKRYTREQMQQIVEDAGKRVFLYQVTDAFGDNGIVAAAIVDTAGDHGSGHELPCHGKEYRECGDRPYRGADAGGRIYRTPRQIYLDSQE